MSTTNLIFALIGARTRNNETSGHAAARLAADTNFSKSTIVRATASGKVSPKLELALRTQLG